MHSSTTLAALAALTLVACGPGEPATDAERLTRGRELVQQMSAHLAGATLLSATTTEVRDLVRLSGATERISLTGVYTLRRPDRFYVKQTGGGGRALETWYDGVRVTLAEHQNKVFAQAPMPETINRTLDALAERYDLPLPMGDLFYAPPEKALLSDTTAGGYVNTETIGDTHCYHLAFQDVGVDWEVWLPVEGEPLPKRFKTVQKGRTGKPMTDVTFASWSLAPEVSDATFTPNLPADYEGIAILQRAAAVKSTLPAQPAAEPAPANKK